MKRILAISSVAIIVGAALTGIVSPAAAVTQAGSDAHRFALGQSSTSDFSISVTPASASVDPGYLISATISTSTIRGSAQPVNLSASGLPTGAAVFFNPSSIATGDSSTMRISTTTATSPGVYPVVITAVGTNATHTTAFTFTVNGPAGCAQTNDTDVTIPDDSTVEGAVLISHCEGDASSTSTVAVAIAHTNIGDLIVNLVAPDGTLYLLHNQTGGSTGNIDQIYTVDLAGETSNGGWKLRVQDVATQETGYLDTWTLNLRTGGSGTCAGTNSTDVAIPDTGLSVDSSITVSGCTGNGSATSTVEVHIAHPRIGDLTVCLVAPNGIVYVLHERTGGSTDDIDQTYMVDLSDKLRDGTWDLTVWDAQAAQIGHLDNWTLIL